MACARLASAWVWGTLLEGIAMSALQQDKRWE